MRWQLRNQSLVRFLVALHSQHVLLLGWSWRTVHHKVLILIYFVFQILDHLKIVVARSYCFAFGLDHWQEILICNLALYRSGICEFRLLMFFGFHLGWWCCFNQLRIGERATLLYSLVKTDVRLVLGAEYRVMLTSPRNSERTWTICC